MRPAPGTVPAHRITAALGTLLAALLAFLPTPPGHAPTLAAAHAAPTHAGPLHAGPAPTGPRADSPVRTDPRTAAPAPTHATPRTDTPTVLPSHARARLAPLHHPDDRPAPPHHRAPDATTTPGAHAPAPAPFAYHPPASPGRPAPDRGRAPPAPSGS
ncbi:hypothetical protein J2S47_001169 [Streptomyces griseoviridis]|uniref:Uncharacterized protein n=1 Tax=Streptomyces griseoviridis TaxID=45398 RepID=A0ABT9LAD0_STRGD|nr:hypothetical protein [Streptomyces griseoviridis]GGS98619.1 hypothetical protein GCM10010240_34910 [Streptomyces griseoviridis]